MKPTLGLVALIFLLLPKLRAQPVTHFFQKEALLNITSSVSTLPIDQAADWSIDDVLANDSLFVAENKLSFKMGGFDLKPQWFKFSVNATHIHPLFAEFAPSLADSITLYHLQENGNLEKSEIGQLMPFSKRALYNHNHTLLLRGTATGETQVFYVRVKAFFPLGLKIRIGQQEAFMTAYHSEDMFYGLFFGVLLLVVLINLFLYPALRDVSYFWYALYLFSLISIIAFYNGHIHQIFFSNTPQYNRAFSLITSLPSVFGCLFAITFLNSLLISPKILRIIKFFIGFSVVNFIIGLLGWLEVSLTIAHIAALPLLGMGIFLAVKSAIQGNNAAKFYLSGWAVFSISLVLNFLDDAGSIPSWDVFRYIVIIGILGEAILMTIAQIARVAVQYTEKRAKDRELIYALEERQIQVHELNQNLERNVAERTQELKGAFLRVQEKESQLAEYAIKLERSNKELTEFAYIVSHDLKAPLRNIGSFTQILEKKNAKGFDDRDREYMNYILTGVQQASTLIDDLLNYSKLDKDIGEPMPINLTRTIERIQLTSYNHLNERNAVITCKNLPIVQAHGSLLSMLFQNLILNGIKYNESATPTVEIGASGVGEKTVFWVRDNGIGIPPQYQQEVFRMFRRLHTAKDYEGTGIGLAFCKRIVATYGGDIWLESTAGEGTVFLFTLPKAMGQKAVVQTGELVAVH